MVTMVFEAGEGHDQIRVFSLSDDVGAVVVERKLKVMTPVGLGLVVRSGPSPWTWVTLAESLGLATSIDVWIGTLADVFVDREDQQ